MTIQDAPWWAKLLSILISQAGLMGAQYLAYLQGGGASVTIAIALLQAIQGSVAANGLGAWAAAGGALVKAGRAIQLGRGKDGAPPGPGGAALVLLPLAVVEAEAQAQSLESLGGQLLGGIGLGPVIAGALALLGAVLVGLGFHRRGRALGHTEGQAQGRAAQASEDRAGARDAATLERAAAEAIEARGQASAARAEASPPAGAVTAAEVDEWIAPPKGPPL